MNRNNHDMCLARLREAVQLHQNGELNQAKKLYRKIVNKDKKNSQAHYLLGLLYQQQVDFSKALKHLKYALLISPADLSFINALEKIYSSQGDILQLQGLIQHCIKYNVENDKIQVKLANLLVKNGQAGIAIGIFESMLDKHRNNWRVWLDFGNCLFFALELERAKQVYQHVLSLKDGQEDALNNLAAIAIEKKQVNEAEGYILRVLSQNHQHVVARYNLANILYERQQRCKAREIVIDLLRDFPDYLEASLLMAKILRCDGDYGSAINIYERLMDKKCVNGILFNDIGNCYFEIGDFNTARIYFSKSLPLPERSNDARFNLATCFLQLKNYDAAIKEFSGLLDIAADYTKAYAPYLHGLRQCCLWNQAEKIESKIKLQLKNRSNINIPPFSMITLESSTSEEQIEIARQWTTRQKRKHPELTGQQVVKLADTPLSGLKLKTADRQRVRLGYFSADFHNHATAILLIRVLELHNREKFECFAYSYGPDDKSKLRKRVENSIEHFREMHNLPKQQMISTIKRDKLDIFVDLKGFTQNSLSEILLSRVAPVQINFLGYPASMSKELVDFIIVDKFILQPDKVFFDEEPLVMPNSYQPTDNTRVIAEILPRSSQGLKDSQFVFAAFHQGYKLNHKTIESWAKILKNCRNSVLWCLSSSKSMASVIRKLLVVNGVNSSKVIFAEKVSPSQHIARLQCADLVLDSFPVNGHTSTSDALWAGIPVVTIAGDTFISRVAGSLLNASGLLEFVCDDFVSYQEKAIEMYQDRKKLQQIRDKLKQERETNLLFDSKGYTTDLEALYVKALNSLTQSNKYQSED